MLFESLPDDESGKMAAHVADKLVDTLLVMRGGIDLESTISLIKSKAKRSGFAYKELHDDTGGRRIIIQHDLGQKYSAFCGAYKGETVQHCGPFCKGFSDRQYPCN